MITSATRTDLLQIDGLYARISKLRYESCDLRKEDWFKLCGTCMAYKDEGQRLGLSLVQEREKERCSNKQNLLYCNIRTE